MSTTRPVSRAAATRLTRGAQGAAGLLALGAVAIFAFGVPTGNVPTGPVETPTAPVITPVADAGTDAEYVEIDYEGITARINQVDNAPTPPEAPSETPSGGGEDGGDTPVGNDVGVADRVAYLGHISIGDGLMALLRVDGTQRTAAPGRAITASGANGLDALTVIRVEQGRVLVRGSGDGVWIDRADGGGAAPSDIVIAAPANPNLARPGQTEAVDRRLANARAREAARGRGDGAALEPDPLKRRLESIERLYEQGRIDEERYNTMRDRAIEQLERANARRDQDEN